MLIVTVGSEQHLDTPDELNRTRTGYRKGMTDRELYQAARGSWVLGEKADGEHFALVAHRGAVLLAIEIHRLVETAPGRRAIEGSILLPGDEVHDAYVGKPVPVESYGNPVRYFDAPVGTKPCRCGCGTSLRSGKFVAGHDAIALHERVRRIGSVAQFIDWFDSMVEPFERSARRQRSDGPDTL
ncbi:hypothetical protein [Glycomyces albidus]|uniref:Uncharacterized protein n=1 Tax=Glycomyces albidus TaxID=2656774 RepID=A0A6L5GAW2_9ACTN|nr:hypothetical protein [Glycomyces albidus]MQM26751.1 hypothetical protein [Glycomyces albidus]